MGQSLPNETRNVPWLSHLHHRPILKVFRDKGRQHRNTRDALLNFPGFAHPLASPTADYKYQGKSKDTFDTQARTTLISSRPQRQSTICELTFPTTVLATKMSRKRLVIVLEHQIYLYDIQTMKLLYTIETSPNPAGTLCQCCPA